jgi:hypothetical protein
MPIIHPGSLWIVIRSGILRSLEQQVRTTKPMRSLAGSTVTREFNLCLELYRNPNTSRFVAWSLNKSSNLSLNIRVRYMVNNITDFH